MDLDHEETPRKKKKGCVNADQYKGNIIKRARVSGVPYINHAKRDIPAKTRGPDCK